MSQLEQTVSRYRSLRLSAAADELTNLLAEAEANEMSYLSFADRLAEHELIQRQDKRIRRNRKMAAFPAEKRLEGFDYRHQTTITKRQVNALLDFQFIDERNNLVFIGPPASAIDAMGDKSAAKALMQQAGMVEVATERDLEQRDRVTLGRMPP